MGTGGKPECQVANTVCGGVGSPRLRAFGTSHMRIIFRERYCYCRSGNHSLRPLETATRDCTHECSNVINVSPWDVPLTLALRRVPPILHWALDIRHLELALSSSFHYSKPGHAPVAGVLSAATAITESQYLSLFCLGLQVRPTVKPRFRAIVVFVPLLGIVVDHTARCI